MRMCPAFLQRMPPESGMEENESSYKVNVVEVYCKKCKRTYTVLASDAHDYVPGYYQTVNHEVRFGNTEDPAGKESDEILTFIEEEERMGWRGKTERHHSVDAMIVDPSPTGGQFYSDYRLIPCPTCGTIEYEDREIRDAPVAGIIPRRKDVPFIVATHDVWNSLSPEEKVTKIREAIAPWISPEDPPVPWPRQCVHLIARILGLRP